MNCRFLVCVPVYNNPKTIVQVIEACVAETPHPILVLDDGSDVPVQSMAAFDPRVSFHRFEKNSGKGVALQKAFQLAVEQGFTHLVTIDGDGQHDPAEVRLLVDCAMENPFALVVGDRDMSAKNVPGSSSFGKVFSNFWVRYQTDVQVSDSQSGFRIYPLFSVQTMSFLCKRYDFEVEVLTRLIWKGVEVRNVKISVQYFTPETRVSHFHKWRDNYRISVINTILTTVALLRERKSPVMNALAAGLGVFVGCTPLFGLHTGIVIVLALLFRLNLIYLWIGTNISVPPLIPFLAIASSQIGEGLTGVPPDGPFAFSKAWLMGSVVLGAVLGGITFVFVLLMFFLRKLRQREQLDQVQREIVGQNQNPWGVAIIRWMMKNLGLRFAYFFLHFVVSYYFLFSLKTRRAFSEYWKVTHSLGFWARQRRIYRQILVFAQTLVDRNYQRMNLDSGFEAVIDSESKELLAGEAGTNPRGTVVVASHFGGWELIMSFLAKSGHQAGLTAVMYGTANQVEHRSSGTDVIHFNESRHTVLRLRDQLSKGQLVGLMGDRPVSRSRELAPFFGKLAMFDSTAIRLARACDSDLYFMFAARESSKRYRVFAFKHDWQAQPEEKQIERAVAAYAGVLEAMVRRYPEQWFNFFPFWSSTASLELPVAVPADRPMLQGV